MRSFSVCYKVIKLQNFSNAPRNCRVYRQLRWRSSTCCFGDVQSRTTSSFLYVNDHSPFTRWRPVSGWGLTTWSTTVVSGRTPSTVTGSHQAPPLTLSPLTTTLVSRLAAGICRNGLGVCG